MMEVVHSLDYRQHLLVRHAIILLRETELLAVLATTLFCSARNWEYNTNTFYAGVAIQDVQTAGVRLRQHPASLQVRLLRGAAMVAKPWTKSVVCTEAQKAPYFLQSSVPATFCGYALTPSSPTMCSKNGTSHWNNTYFLGFSFRLAVWKRCSTTSRCSSSSMNVAPNTMTSSK